MTDDLVKRWDEYVESMPYLMGEVEHMAQQMRERIDAQAAEIEWYRDRVVWGFYEDETPKFYQGKEGEHEICEPVSAKEVSNYISEIERLKAALERGLSRAKGIEMACLGLRDEAQPMTAKEAARKMIAELTGGKDE